MVYYVSCEDRESRSELLRRIQHRICEGTRGIAGAHPERKGRYRNVLGAIAAKVSAAEGLGTVCFGIDLEAYRR